MDCEKCDYFEGRDYETGEPHCEYDGDCPYEEQGEQEARDGALTVTIGLDDMKTRIESAFNNAIAHQVSSAVTRMIEDEFGNQIRARTREAVESLLTQKVAEFMEQPIHIGGGWREPERTLTRDAYVTELVEKSLNEKFDQDTLAATITASVKREVSDFAQSTQKQVNRNIENMFNEAMRASLTDSIVSMLMNNDTYRQLSGSMQHLIEGAKQA